MSARPVAFDRDAVLREMRASWDDFDARRNRLSADRLTGSVDAAGWTGKDHLMHLVCWGNAAYDLVEGVPRYRSFGIEPGLYRSQDFDAINAVLQERYRDVPLERVDLYLAVMRRRAMQVMESIEAPAVMRPYGWYSPDGMPNLLGEPVLRFLLGTQARHLLAHLEYAESIAGS
jgi:hypothetical protein